MPLHDIIDNRSEKLVDHINRIPPRKEGPSACPKPHKADGTYSVCFRGRATCDNRQDFRCTRRGTGIHDWWVIYLRHGSADVQAQPDDLTRLLAEFAS